MAICYITVSLLLLIIAVYLYCQNRILATNLKNEKEEINCQKTFVATVVHDLKTPTYAQLNSLNLLKNETLGKLNPEQQEIINITHESCKYMSNLIGTIMETYAYDLGKTPMNKSDFDIVNLIKKICEETKILSENKHQKVLLETQEHSIIVHADKLQIERVILNLISNAITYGFAGTDIRIFARKSDEMFEFNVVSKSREIPQKELLTLFEKFKKSKYGYSNNTGNGLGLYLAKQIIEKHYGEMCAQSTKDGTCTFGFHLPQNIEQKMSVR